MLLEIVNTVNSYLSDYILVFLLIGVGLWYTIRTRFVQIRYFGEGMRRLFGNLSLRGGRQERGMSSFQAVATAIAAQVGTGNIVGSAGAILTGGPGAIFWMWIIAFFGMATIYAEATLAIQTRKQGDDGSYHGGPVYYITTAFQGGFGKFLAGFFAVAIILALGCMGCMVQSNSIGSTFQTAFNIPSWIVGIVLVVICAFIFLGGVQRLASSTPSSPRPSSAAASARPSRPPSARAPSGASSPMRRAWAPPPTPTPRPTSRRPMSRAWWR